MPLFRKPNSVGSTPFSDFIRNASAAEKKRVYTEVMKIATAQQNALIGAGLASGPGKPADDVFDRLDAKYRKLAGKRSAKLKGVPE